MTEDTKSPNYRVFGIAMILNLLVLGGHCFVTGRLTVPPSIHDDHIEYDSLGWEWSQGRGFQLHLTNEEFRSSYVDPQLDEHAESIGADEPWPTATRPPGFPFLLAAGNKIFGRQFWFGRVVNLLAVAVVCGVLCTVAMRTAGNLAAILAWLQFSIIDVRPRIMSRELLTEALAMLVVAVVTCALIRWVQSTRHEDNDQDSTRSNSIRWLITAAMVLGLGLLLRTAFVLWMPVFTLMMILIGGIRNKASYLGAIAFVFLAVLVYSPWAIRNISQLDSFAPLGTLGPRDAAAAYSDRAIDDWGQWHSLRRDGFFTEVDEGKRGLEAEKARGELSVSVAKTWISGNWYKLPVLAVMRVISEVRPRNLSDLYVLVFAVLGFVAWRRSTEASVSLWVVAACLFGIAITWSVAGRFMYPVMFPMHLMAAVGAATAWRAAWESSQRSASDGTRSINFLRC